MEWYRKHDQQDEETPSYLLPCGLFSIPTFTRKKQHIKTKIKETQTFLEDASLSNTSIGADMIGNGDSNVSTERTPLPLLSFSIDEDRERVFRVGIGLHFCSTTSRIAFHPFLLLSSKQSAKSASVERANRSLELGSSNRNVKLANEDVSNRSQITRVIATNENWFDKTWSFFFVSGPDPFRKVTIRDKRISSGGGPTVTSILRSMKNEKQKKT
jgi:hypothetical protein